MISMYARHGGIDNMMAAIKNGTASKKLLYDYYTSANEKNKPVALNLYLKALPTKELIDVDNKLIDEISLYDKELMTRLVEEIVPSHTIESGAQHAVPRGSPARGTAFFYY